MDIKQLKYIFFGSSEFSVIILQTLLAAGYVPQAIVTTPDKPSGRKKILTPTPVKILALKKNIPIGQPEKLDENFYINVAADNKKSDIFIVASYGKIMPQNVLDLPKLGCLNIHPSLLPKYRGASPIQTALLNGDKKTGVTLMLMDEKMDHGPILSSVESPIGETEKFLELHQRLASTGGKLLLKILPDFLNGKIKASAQNHAAATFSKIINKSDGEINWQKTAQEIYNQWRAFQVWPGIHSQLTINNKQLLIKFIEINLSAIKSETGAGEFIIINKKLYLTAGDKKLLEIIKLQPQGKKEMSAGEFINGYLK